MSDDKTKETEEAATSTSDADEILSRKHVMGLARDSGVAIAGAVALLYLTSHVFGTQYLEIYGVSSGFHQFGLANLAMIPTLSYISLFFIGLIIHTSLRHGTRETATVAVVVLSVILLVRPLFALAYGADFEWGDPSILAEIMAMFLFFRVRTFYHKNTKKLTAQSIDHLKEITNATMTLWSESKATHPVDESPEVQATRSVLLEGLRNSIPVAEANRDQIGRRLRHLRIFLVLAAGAMTVGVAIPGLATVSAVIAASQRGFAPITSNAPIRIPAYWVGDRVVFLTAEGSHCYVHVQIANVEQSKNLCPPLIAAVAPP